MARAFIEMQRRVALKSCEMPHLPLSSDQGSTQWQQMQQQHHQGMADVLRQQEELHHTYWLREHLNVDDYAQQDTPMPEQQKRRLSQSSPEQQHDKKRLHTKEQSCRTHLVGHEACQLQLFPASQCSQEQHVGSSADSVPAQPAVIDFTGDSDWLVDLAQEPDGELENVTPCSNTAANVQVPPQNQLVAVLRQLQQQVRKQQRLQQQEACQQKANAVQQQQQATDSAVPVFTPFGLIEACSRSSQGTDAYSSIIAAAGASAAANNASSSDSAASTKAAECFLHSKVSETSVTHLTLPTNATAADAQAPTLSGTLIRDMHIPASWLAKASKPTPPKVLNYSRQLYAQVCSSRTFLASIRTLSEVVCIQAACMVVSMKLMLCWSEYDCPSEMYEYYTEGLQDVMSLTAAELLVMSAVDWRLWIEEAM